MDGAPPAPRTLGVVSTQVCRQHNAAQRQQRAGVDGDAKLLQSSRGARGAYKTRVRLRRNLVHDRSHELLERDRHVRPSLGRCARQGLLRGHAAAAIVEEEPLAFGVALRHRQGREKRLCDERAQPRSRPRVAAHAWLLVHLFPSSTSGGEEQTLRNCARPIVIVTLREHAH